MVGCHMEFDPGYVSDYQVDSRKVGEGSLFFALQGERVDGHQFLKEAAQRGALGAVVSKQYLGPDYGLCLMSVEDVEETLQEMARRRMAQFQGKVIGVTGSVGKTTSKDWIGALLSQKYRVNQTPCNQNTKLSLPLTLLNEPKEADIWVLEMGMSQAGDLSRLLNIVSPEIALITKVSLAHASFFPDGLRGIARGKGEIFQGQALKTAVFDYNYLPYLERREGVEYVSFSVEHVNADYVLSQGAFFERGNKIADFKIPFRETHFMHNVLAALVIARTLDVALEKMRGAVCDLKAPHMRFERLEKKGVLFVNDAYNASPESMQAALLHLPMPKKGGKRIALLGSMKELGDFSEKEHQKVGILAKQVVDVLLLLGEETLQTYRAFIPSGKPCHVCGSHDEMLAKLKETARNGDVVLLKGSRSMKLETILEMY